MCQLTLQYFAKWIICTRKKTGSRRKISKLASAALRLQGFAWLFFCYASFFSALVVLLQTSFVWVEGEFFCWHCKKFSIPRRTSTWQMPLTYRPYLIPPYLPTCPKQSKKQCRKRKILWKIARNCDLANLLKKCVSKNWNACKFCETKLDCKPKAY